MNLGRNCTNYLDIASEQSHCLTWGLYSLIALSWSVVTYLPATCAQNISQNPWSDQLESNPYPPPRQQAGKYSTLSLAPTRDIWKITNEEKFAREEITLLKTQKRPKTVSKSLTLILATLLVTTSSGWKIRCTYSNDLSLFFQMTK